jgi:hypothetical protein
MKQSALDNQTAILFPKTSKYKYKFLFLTIKIVAFDTFLQEKLDIFLSHIGLYSVIPISYVWDKSLQYLFCCGFHLHLN